MKHAIFRRLLALVLALSLAACGAKSAGPDTMTGDYNGYLLCAQAHNR